MLSYSVCAKTDFNPALLRERTMWYTMQEAGKVLWRLLQNHLPVATHFTTHAGSWLQGRNTHARYVMCCQLVCCDILCTRRTLHQLV
jgi:hypothetical protein